MGGSITEFTCRRFCKAEAEFLECMDRRGGGRIGMAKKLSGPGRAPVVAGEF